MRSCIGIGKSLRPNLHARQVLGRSAYVTGSLKASARPYHSPLCCKKFCSLSILLIKPILGIGNLSLEDSPIRDEEKV